MSTALSRPRLGAFGHYGGRYTSELLHPALDQLRRAMEEQLDDSGFIADFENELASWAGRPTPLTHLNRLSEVLGLDVYAKREDLLHGGAHKTNNVIGQALLARAMGKRCLIAETGAGQHGVATAMVAARLGLEARIYMGAKDVARQSVNVETMRLCGAQLIPVDQGGATLKDAINEALRDWTADLERAHYLLGTVCGPDPFPSLVGRLQSVIGREARQQIITAEQRLPDLAVACVGGGSNAIGLWTAFLDDPVELLGAEPGGCGLDSGKHGATLCKGRPGLLHGARSYLLQDEDGQVTEPMSIAAGLDYPGVGPQHAALLDAGRARYCAPSNDEALDAFEELSALEGIVPAFESAHAFAALRSGRREGSIREGALVLINLSGRGQKDLASHAQMRGAKIG